MDEEELMNELVRTLKRTEELADDFNKASSMITVSYFLMIFVAVLSIIMTIKVLGWL